jgi:hypothetical protein
MRTDLDLNLPGLRRALSDSLLIINNSIDDEIAAVGDATWIKQEQTSEAVLVLTDLASRLRRLLEHLEPVDDAVEAVVEGRSQTPGGSVRLSLSGSVEDLGDIQIDHRVRISRVS